MHDKNTVFTGLSSTIPCNMSFKHVMYVSITFKNMFLSLFLCHSVINVLPIKCSALRESVKESTALLRGSMTSIKCFAVPS